jgi:hypothetical protein
MAEILRKRDTRGTAIWRWLVTLGLVIGVAAQTRADLETQLEAAIHREVVLGDLPGALEQYQAIVSQPSAPKNIAARAVFQMAQCLEKTGRRKEARAAYGRVATEYGDLAEVAALARSRIAGWEESLAGPQNLNFEQGVAGKAPPFWFVPALPKDADGVAQLQRIGCRSRIGCAVVLAPDKAPNQSGTLMQSFPAAAYRGKAIRLRASLRLDSAIAEDHAQMWLYVDRPNARRGFVDDMSDRPVRSSEWTRCEISGAIDADATFINFGVTTIGRGRVWVDEVSFEVIPK